MPQPSSHPKIRMSNTIKPRSYGGIRTFTWNLLENTSKDLHFLSMVIGTPPLHNLSNIFDHRFKRRIHSFLKTAWAGALESKTRQRESEIQGQNQVISQPLDPICPMALSEPNLKFLGFLHFYFCLNFHFYFWFS